jgi:FtsP/CotA-like multicopper oxidase with cupredoxin domain
MHLHGHFLEIVDAASGRPTGLVKDTVLVEPMGQVHVDFMADNPGRWLMHCHHAYHMEAGMARLVEYR